jgi:hypothetical protein
VADEQIRVGCYSGGRYGERPRWVEREGRRVAVASIDGQWRQQERLVFEVTLEDKERLVLYYYPQQDVWLGVKK